MKTQKHWVLVVVCLLTASLRAQEPAALIAEPGHVIRDTRGVLLYQGKLEGDTFSGQIRTAMRLYALNRGWRGEASLRCAACRSSI